MRVTNAPGWDNLMKTGAKGIGLGLDRDVQTIVRHQIDVPIYIYNVGNSINIK